MWAPSREPVNAARQRLPMEMAADDIWKPFHLPGRFLHEKQVRLFSFYERSDVLYRRAYPAKQIPANNFQRDDLSGRPARAAPCDACTICRSTTPLFLSAYQKRHRRGLLQHLGPTIMVTIPFNMLFVSVKVTQSFRSLPQHIR